MADGFDECHKKRLVSKPGVCDPLAHSLYRMKELLRKEACGSAACFFQYLHPNDPDVNHVDLLTSLLIVYCFLVDVFFFSFLHCLVSLHLRSFTAVGVQVHVCWPACKSVCVCVCASVYV